MGDCRIVSAAFGTALILGSALAFYLGVSYHKTSEFILGSIFGAAGMGLGGVAIYFQILKNRQVEMDKNRLEQGLVENDRSIEDRHL